MKKACHCHELLLSHGIEPTEHREAVLNIFTKAQKTLTAKYVLDKLHDKSGVDKVTIYRILDLFVQKKILKSVVASQGTMAYEIFCLEHRPVHPHFICRECGDIQCLEEISMKDLKFKIKPDRKIKGEEIEIRLQGLCAACNK